MNRIVNKFLLSGDKFVSEMHLKQPRFTYSACGQRRNSKFKETGDTKYICRNKLDKACFQHDMAYGNFKDLAKRTVSDKVLRNKAFNITKDPKYDGYQRGLASVVYKFFGKKTSGSGANNKIKQNQQLANELHKSIIKKFKKRRAYSSFKIISGVLI